MKRSNVKTTDAASNGVPSWKRMFLRRSKVRVLPSGGTDQRSASLGSSSTVSPLYVTKVSQRLWMTLASSPHSISAGSRVDESALRAQIRADGSAAPSLQDPRSARKRTQRKFRVMLESVVGAGLRPVNETLGDLGRPGIVNPMDVIGFLSLECPALIPAARRDPSRAAVLNAFDEMVAVGKDEAGGPLYPRATVAVAVD